MNVDMATTGYATVAVTLATVARAEVITTYAFSL